MTKNEDGRRYKPFSSAGEKHIFSERKIWHQTGEAEKMLKHVWQLIISTSSTTLEVPSMCPCGSYFISSKTLFQVKNLTYRIDLM